MLEGASSDKNRMEEAGREGESSVMRVGFVRAKGRG